MGLYNKHLVPVRNRSIYELSELANTQRAYRARYPSQVVGYKSNSRRLTASRLIISHTPSKYVDAKYSHAVSANHPWRHRSDEPRVKPLEEDVVVC